MQSQNKEAIEVLRACHGTMAEKSKYGDRLQEQAQRESQKSFSVQNVFNRNTIFSFPEAEFNPSLLTAQPPKIQPISIPFYLDLHICSFYIW